MNTYHCLLLTVLVSVSIRSTEDLHRVAARAKISMIEELYSFLFSENAMATCLQIISIASESGVSPLYPTMHPSHQRHARTKNSKCKGKVFTRNQDCISIEEGCFCIPERRRCCPSQLSRILRGWRLLARQGTSRLRERLYIQILEYVC